MNYLYFHFDLFNLKEEVFNKQRTLEIKLELLKNYQLIFKELFFSYL